MTEQARAQLWSCANRAWPNGWSIIGETEACAAEGIADVNGVVLTEGKHTRWTYLDPLTGERCFRYGPRAN